VTKKVLEIIKEESLVHNSKRSGCLTLALCSNLAGNLTAEGNHGAYYDAKIGRFLQQDSMAFPNQVNGMNRMMYVEGNPVSYRDMSGNSTNYSHMLNQIIKHAIIGGIAKVAKGIKNTTDRISEGKNNRKGADFGSIAPRRLGEAGTFVRRFFTNIKFASGVLLGIVDYTLSTLNGNNPSISYHNGGFVINNSYLASLEVSFVYGGVAHIQKGESSGVRKHEVGHIKQDLHGGFYANQNGVLEWANDLTEGTLNYAYTPFLMNDLYREETYEVLKTVNMYYDPVNTVLLDEIYKLFKNNSLARLFLAYSAFD
jgi:RHS repeat-associated protein